MTETIQYENNFDEITDFKDFAREGFRDQFINIINSNFYKHICLNAEWGSGKTVFIKQLIKYLEFKDEENKGDKNRDINIYFDAWEYENYTDPVLALLRCVSRQNEKFINKIVNGSDFKIDVKVGLDLWFLKIDATQNKGDEYQGEYLKTLYIEEQVFNVFNQIVENLTKEKDIKIRIFIDELDRCNPKFAMRLIEVFHHFDNKDVTFIYSTDKNQLTSLVKHYYGEDYSSKIFFDKIFDKEIILRTITQYEIKNYAIDKFREIQQRISGNAIDFLQYVNFTLRDINVLAQKLETFSKSYIARVLLNQEGFNNFGLLNNSVYIHLTLLTHIIVIHYSHGIDLYNMTNQKNVKEFVLHIEPFLKDNPCYYDSIINDHIEKLDIVTEGKLTKEKKLEYLNDAIIVMFQSISEKNPGPLQNLFDI